MKIAPVLLALGTLVASGGGTAGAQTSAPRSRLAPPVTVASPPPSPSQERVNQVQPSIVPPNMNPSQGGVVSEVQLTPALAPGVVANAQVALTGMGLYRGPVSGTLTGVTRAALRSFQASAQLPVTGELDLATAQRLGIGVQLIQPTAPAASGVAAPAPVAAPATPTAPASVGSTASPANPVRAAQLQLAGMGLLARAGVSGVIDADTEQALLAFQTASGLPPTGALDLATLQALGVGGSAPLPNPTASGLSELPSVVLPQP
jgi:peptidoglycan hydrolase-like protein with peptidoglycan-binding domain